MKPAYMSGGTGMQHRSKAASKLKVRDVYRASNLPRRKAEMAKKGPTF